MLIILYQIVSILTSSAMSRKSLLDLELYFGLPKIGFMIFSGHAKLTVLVAFNGPLPPEKVQFHHAEIFSRILTVF